MAGRQRPRPACQARASFDVWSHHPYTSGGPNRHAPSPDDVFVADLPEMRRLLAAARRAGRIRSAGRPRFWITEFAWDTNPPDPGGLPVRLQARWTAEAFYRMWTTGVDRVVWLQLRDAPEIYHAGLFRRTVDPYSRERRKPVARVVRFPFAAVRSGGRVAVWGRTPAARRQRVVIERRADGTWRRVARLRTNAGGVFHARRLGLAGALVRARVGTSRALPFRAVRTRDRDATPFGTR